MSHNRRGRPSGVGSISNDPLDRINSTLDKIARIQKDSYKVLHSFSNHSQGIAARASKIQRDVSEWERALTNLNKTRDAVSVASEAYHIPSCVAAVLEGKDKSAAAFSESLKALTRSKEFLEVHQSNPVGEKLEERVGDELDEVTDLAEQHIVDAVIQELERIEQRRKINETNAAGARRGGAGGRFGERPPSYSYSRVSMTPGGGGLFSMRPDEDEDQVEFGGDEENDNGDEGRDEEDNYSDASGDSMDREHRRAKMKGRKVTLAEELKKEDLHGEPFSSDLKESLALIVKTLHTTCDRRDVATALTESVAEHCAKIVESALPPTYLEDYHGVGAAVRPYKKGSHPLIASVRKVRREVKQVLVVLETVVLAPMENDIDVISVPGFLIEAVLDEVVSKMCAAITTPMNHLRDLLGKRSNTLPPFALGGNCGVDLIFLGLNFLEELWPWRQMAAKSGGDSDLSRRLVDDLIQDGVLELVQEMLHEYKLGRGILSDDFLRENPQLMPKQVARSVYGDPSATGESWAPPADCMVHPLTATLAHFLTNIFTENLGALKIVLASEYLLNYSSSCVSCTANRPTWTAEAKQEVAECLTREGQQLLMAVVVDHGEDLVTIGYTARSMKLKKLGATNDGGGVGIDLDDLANLFSSTEGTAADAVCNPPLLMLNNYYFLLETLTGEKNSQNHHASSIFGNSSSNAGEGAGGIPRNFAAPVIQGLRSEYENTKQYFADFWISILPPFLPAHKALVEEKGMPPGVDYEVLCSIMDDLSDTEGLTKEMRWTVKQWNKQATLAVQRELSYAKHHGLMDRKIRPQLLQDAATRIQDAFEALDSELLYGREWSTRPEKWYQIQPDKLPEEMGNLY